MHNQYTRVRLACYTVNIMMSIVANLPPILFLTFRSLYGITYSQMGLLILINYMTQLGVDLIFSFFSHKINIHKAVKSTPVFMLGGFLIFAGAPAVFPEHIFLGLALGTVIFSAAAGLGEVLISPLIAALPAKDPDREMSKLHSIYAWGTSAVVIAATVFLQLFGKEKWQYLALIMLIIPLISICLFSGTKLPQMQTHDKSSGGANLFRNKWLWLSSLAIFLGGAAECTMAQWSSGYLEQALNIPKIWGDMFGVALFAVMLGLGRTLYAKFGKHLERILLLSSIGATVCYLCTAITDFPLLGLLACAFTGFCTAMLWPGNLVVAAERFPSGGVFLYAFTAAAGDLGASVGPQLVGIITDVTVASTNTLLLAQRLNLTAEQLGMKLGMLTGMLFPLISIPLFCVFLRAKKKETNK